MTHVSSHIVSPNNRPQRSRSNSTTSSRTKSRSPLRWLLYYHNRDYSISVHRTLVFSHTLLYCYLTCSTLDPRPTPPNHHEALISSAPPPHHTQQQHLSLCSLPQGSATIALTLPLWPPCAPTCLPAVPQCRAAPAVPCLSSAPLSHNHHSVPSALPPVPRTSPVVPHSSYASRHL